MKTSAVSIPTPDGVCDAFVAYPNDKGIFSPVILLMDAFGLRPYLEEMGTQLAALGYFVLVPNLFYRIKKAPVLELTFPLNQQQEEEALLNLRPMIQNYSPEHCLSDVKSFKEYMSRQKRVRPGKMGITGYCMGGSLAFRIAARYSEDVAAVASFHAGRLATDQPDSPHLLLSKIKAEVYVGHADKDKSMPADRIVKFEKALAQTSLACESELYKGAAHGFTMRDLPSYNAAALTKHWSKLAELFSRNL